MKNKQIYCNTLLVGFHNCVATTKILAITDSDSAPMRRLRQEAENNSKFINCTGGKKTKSLVHLSEGFVVASSVQRETLAARMEGKEIAREDIDF